MTYLRALIAFIHRLRTGTHQDPVRDWLTLITISVIVLAGSIVWSVWAFETVAKGGIIGTAPIATPEVFNRSVLDSIQTIFSSRSTEQSKYTDGIYLYADPSQ